MTIPVRRAGASLEAAAEVADPVGLATSWPHGAPAAKSTVRLAWNPRELFVRADFEDADVWTRATGHNQHFWELGDVFEIFIEAAGAGFYTEMHVAPGNFRLHMRIRPEDFLAVQAKSLVPSDLMVHPPEFESRSQPTDVGWSVEAIIPAAAVDPEGQITPSSQWIASFCRYDAWADGRPPVLSSTSPSPHPSFHSRQYWRRLCF